MAQMTIEDYLRRSAEAQERSAKALEALVELAQNPITTTVVNRIEAAPEVILKEQSAAGKAAAGNEKDKSTAPAPAVEQPKQAEPEVDPLDEEPKPTPPRKVKIEDLRARLKAYREANGAPAMMEILSKVGGASALSELKEDKYAAVFDAAAV